MPRAGPSPPGRGGRRPGEGRQECAPFNPHPPLRGTLSQRERDLALDSRQSGEKCWFAPAYVLASVTSQQLMFQRYYAFCLGLFIPLQAVAQEASNLTPYERLHGPYVAL